MERNITYVIQALLLKETNSLSNVAFCFLWKEFRQGWEFFSQAQIGFADDFILKQLIPGTLGDNLAR